MKLIILLLIIAFSPIVEAGGRHHHHSNHNHGPIGSEISAKNRLSEGDEFRINPFRLIEIGKEMFAADWTIQEGAGRPLTKGVGAPLADLSDPLVFPRNFNRLSSPEANGCGGCHNKPRLGGGGDIVANVFVTGQRFDHLTFDHDDTIPTKGSVDESGRFVQLQNAANSRNTLGMFGSGYLDMMSRQMTEDLQHIRDTLMNGMAAPLETKGVSFGYLLRNIDGTYDVSEVEGLLPSSLSGPIPSLIIQPFHQAGGAVSVRHFTNNAFNHHHGIQPSERFGNGVDADGDGFVDEINTTEITAVSVFQAQLAVPGRVIPNDPEIEQAVKQGEILFDEIGCTSCHVASLPLDNRGWIYTEPNPYNPEGNLRPGDRAVFSLNLNDKRLDLPRLKKKRGVVNVPAFTDLKLHDITSGPDDPNREPLDQNAKGDAFFDGNSKFLTKKLWGIANEPPYFHHGKFTTMREAIEAHRGEALPQYNGWLGIGESGQASIIEFLKTLQVLPEGTKHLVVDENGRKKKWKSYFDK